MATKLDDNFLPFVDALTAIVAALHKQGIVSIVLAIDVDNTENIKLLSNITDMKLAGELLAKIGKRLSEGDDVRISSQLLPRMVQ